ncbi:MAG TPA: DUF2779 domain-containing protein [Thermomicrobiales bacterium]|nr:DUF2779 domain-containing protein [Thermomicrobiales bacterium]
MGDATIYLTGTDVLNYRICPAWCWTAKHRPDLVPPATEHDLRREDDEARVAAVARTRFPNGALIDSEDPAEATRLTEQAIAAGAATFLSASVVSPSGLHARADILARHPSGEGWRLIEVRASTSIDAEKRLDATFQRIAFADAGYDIRSVEVMYLNKRYRRNGHLDLDDLFRFDISVIRWGDGHRSRILADIDAAWDVVHGDSCPPCRCDCVTRGRRCPTFDLFHPSFPNGGETVFDLVSINQKRLAEVLERGVIHLADWPEDLSLSQRQQWQVEAVRSGEELVREEMLRAFLAEVEFPVHFLDYETFQVPVPLHTGMWPYQQVPFQYSVHVLHEDGTLEHREFLWKEAGAPSIRPIAESLREHIADEGSVVVWWKGFEGKRNEELAAAVPELAEFFHGLNTRMIDLMETVTRGMWVHPGFNGSSSIKKVLPVVDPDMSYDELEIGHGSVATLRWKQCVVDETPPEGVDPDEAFDQLRQYCRLDTLAMVRIWEHLGRLAGIGVSALAP